MSEVAPKVALSNDFLKAFAKLPRSKQKKVRSFTEKFRMNPTSSGINYEKLAGAVDDKVRSVRIDQAYRAIVVQPPQGDVYLLVWVDNHDDAYQWVENKRFDVNPQTGALQVYTVSEAITEVDPEPVPQEAPETVPEGRLLGGLSHDDLRECGVPDLLIPSVRALRTEVDLDELARYLPGEAADTLYMVVAGMTVAQALQEVDLEHAAEAAVDTSSFEKALDHPDSKRRFKVVGTDDELAKILDEPLAQWRIFLHPSQRKLVEREEYSGPARVLGGAGTGKTVVLMHRARFLAREVFDEPDDRVLVTTYTKNLAGDLRTQLGRLCDHEFERIEVDNLHAWAIRFMASQGVHFGVATGAQCRNAMKQATQTSGGSHNWRFYQDEWDKVVQAQDIVDRDGYFFARRKGRGTGMTRRERAEAWKVFDTYRRILDENGLSEWADIIRETRLYIEQNPDITSRYKAVLCDETQDMREADLRLIRTIVPRRPNDLFFVGDAHQRIYGHRASMLQCGVDIRGRGKRLRLNYRTTEQIGRWAVALLKGMTVDDLDEGVDDLTGYHSVRHGPPPEIELFADEDGEAEAIVVKVSEWIDDDPESASDLCVAARTNNLAKHYADVLDSAGIATQTINQNSDDSLGDGVRIATMHRMKGLEFRRVLLAGVQDGTMPFEPKYIEFADTAAKEDYENGEKCLLYVAATRARDELAVTGSGSRSPLVDVES